MTSREHRRFVCLVAAGVAASVVAMHANMLSGIRPARLVPQVPAVQEAREPATARAPAVAAVAEPLLPDLASAFDALEQALISAEPGMRDRVLADRLPALTLRDPARAARFAELLTDARLRELAFLQVAMSWARSDPAAAVNWAESLSDAQARDAGITDISLALAETSPARAVALRERFVDPGASLPDNTLVNLAHQWAEQDFDAALAWANAQPPGPQRDQVLQRLVFVRAAAGEFTAAAELARSAIAAPGIRAEALAAVAQQEN